MVFRFSGTGATVRMNDASGYFTVLIDGVEQPRLETTTGAQDYVVASGLADGEHTVELYRRSEALYGVTRVESVSPQGTLLAPPVTARRVEIIGDSITCGNCNEGASGGPFAADTENHYLTYGSIAARAVGAELHAVCESGIGMFCNYSGTGYPPLPGFYDRALKSESTGWNFSSWQPHVVVINLGVNDFAGEGCRGLATLGSSYEDAYVAFLAHLRNKYPSASILCALAPSVAINWIYPYSDARARVQSAVQRRNDAGDAKVRWVDISPASVVAGCTGHPNVATHEAMAAKLVVELEKETW
jgi:lysophospholipase L1-like esterase